MEGETAARTQANAITQLYTIVGDYKGSLTSYCCVPLNNLWLQLQYPRNGSLH